jgi:hypothetical protein
MAGRIAIVLVFLYVTALAMVHGTIGSVAAGGRIGSGKRLSERGSARYQQRKERCDCQEFS